MSKPKPVRPVVLPYGTPLIRAWHLRRVNEIDEDEKMMNSDRYWNSSEISLIRRDRVLEEAQEARG